MCMDVILDTLLLIIQSMGCVVLAAMQKKSCCFLFCGCTFSGKKSGTLIIKV